MPSLAGRGTGRNHWLSGWFKAIIVPEIPAELRQKLTGHADKTVHSLYTHTSLERLRDAVDKLPSVT